jgi:hypothetical protein
MRACIVRALMVAWRSLPSKRRRRNLAFVRYSNPGCIWLLLCLNLTPPLLGQLVDDYLKDKNYDEDKVPQWVNDICEGARSLPFRPPSSV